MTVILPQNYHGRKTLERTNVPWKTREDALREDIRALRIGILNIMPQADTYEFNLLQPLGHSVIQVEPIWIRLKMHSYTSTSEEHLKNLYISFKESVENSRFDGLIITGAPVEEIPFDKISYWNEIVRILKYARNNIASTLGICWGAIAIAKYLGIDKQNYALKVSGVFSAQNLDVSHGITGGMGDVFMCPQSRHSGLKNEDVERAVREGVVKALAYSEPGGYVILESTDKRFLMHLGHPEYRAGRLVEEYNRDIAAGRKDVNAPQNIDLEKPVNSWRTHRTEFFSQWVRYIHETTAY
jgi:homoserine O-succinyltransferase